MSLAGIFLDRDGTLISHVDYLHDPEEVLPLQGIAETLRALREAGYLLFLFTNQSGVGRGFFQMEAVHACNSRMLELMKLSPISLPTYALLRKDPINRKFIENLLLASLWRASKSSIFPLRRVASSVTLGAMSRLVSMPEFLPL